MLLPSVPACRPFLLGALGALVCAGAAHAANPPPTQLFYVPFPEDQQLAAFDAINSVANDPITVFVTLAAATDGTVIYYDHWEDGYEKDITNPVQSTTRIFGDGNPANGYPPGNPADLIPAGTVFNLRNFVATATLQSVVDYDGRDKIASFKPISVTKTTVPAGTDTLLAGCTEVFERGLWGTEYRSPVGVDMPQTTPTATLTQDENLFSYTALAISAGPGGATVQVDKDNNGVFEETVTLAEGEAIFRSSVNVGGHVLADKPVQVILFTGTIGSTYASRDTSLLPTYRWASDYFAPVSTRTSPADGTVTFLYNPADTAITVNYDYRSSTTAYTTASISVPAKGNARVTLQPANSNPTTHYGAYRFYTTGANPPLFYAISAIDADSSSGNNQNWDGGFTLVGRPSLTTQVLLSLGIGRDPYSSVSPSENGNPLWITTSGNGHTPETVYIDYNGDNVGQFTDPNGNHYDRAESLLELQQLKIFDPDGDQSGMLVYTLNPSVRIAAAWGQDPAVATVAQPGLDVASLVPPMREGDGGKRSTIAVDSDGDGVVSCGDTLEYDIRGVSNARTNIPGPFNVQDNLPSTVTYVAGTTRYRFMVGGAWQAWTTIADNTTGTPFPLDGTGFSVPGNLHAGQQFQVTFRATIVPRASLTGSTIENTGQVEISPYGLLLPISWTDTVYGSLGDRVWSDLDGDGVQDAGENGIPNIDVYIDYDNDGVRDADEPLSTTNASGNYLFTGLAAGTYTVRVDNADIAAANVGYGPTYDIDGIATSHRASVTLGIAEDKTDADFGYRVGASVGDRVWVDRDGDGVQENGEPGINGVRVYLDLNSNGTYDTNEPNTITSGDGTWYIGNLNAGTYLVRIDTTTLPVGATQTFDLDGTGTAHRASVTLLGAEHRGDLDFGYRGSYSIGDLVWEDRDGTGVVAPPTSTTYTIYNGRIDINNSGGADNNDDGFIGTMRIINGYVDIDNDNSNPTDSGDDGAFLGYTIIDGGFDINSSGSISNSDDGSATYTVINEPGIANVRVYLDMDGDSVFDATEPSAVTDSAGAYSIGNLFNGTYTVRVDTSTVPSSYIQTYDLTNPSTDHTATVVINGANRTDADFGYRNDASLGDLVWNDRDGDGVRDAGEPGIPGVWVYIDADNDNYFDQGIERYAVTDLTGYYRFENLAAGTYSVRVDISTLPQGSTQTYDLDATLDHETNRTLTTSQEATDVDFGYRASASFGDFVWNDADADSVQDVGELGIANVRVYADINGDGIFQSATEPSALTDSNGAYTIGNLVPGTYTARVDVSTLTAGMTQTFDATGGLDHAATFTLSATQGRTEIDFGYTSPVSIGDLVWNDVNGDGQKGASEVGIAGVGVTLYRGGNDTIAGTTTTNASGLYSFTGLMPGSYYVIFDPVAGYLRSAADQGADTSDSDANAMGRTPTITLTSGQSNLTLDAGYFQPGIITGSVLADTNNDNTGDVGISGVVITLKDSSGNDIDSDPNTSGVQPTTTTTNASGIYTFSSLTPGSYQVVQTQPAGYLTVTDGDTTTPGDDAANASTTDNMIPVSVAANETDTGNDFIEEQPGVISGTVWADTNNDNTGDVGIVGVTLTLFTDPNGDGNPADGVAYGSPVVTVTGGTYSFTNVPPGSYVVVQTQPSGYLTVTDGDTTTPADDAANPSTTDNRIPVAVTANETDNGNDFVEEQPGTISGTVWADTNNDNAGDVGIVGVTLTLFTDPNADGNPADGVQYGSTTATVTGGAYSFTNLPPGAYVVVETQPSGYLTVTDGDTTTPGDDAANASTTDDRIPVAVSANETDNGNDFVEEQPGTISGTVWADTNNDNAGDVGIVGVTLTLFTDPNADGNPADGVQYGSTTATVTGGTYSFTNLPPGAYVVVETQPSGYLTVTDGDTITPGDDAANASTTDDRIPVAVGANETDNGNDFVEEQPGAISGTVWADTNNDNTGDVGIAGVVITLKDGSGNDIDSDPNTSGVQATTITTNASGVYAFTNLPPGSYQVVETQPAGYLTVTDGDTTTPGDDAANASTTDNMIPVAVNANETDTGNDFVEEQPGTISGTVWADTNNDNTGDVGISGVTLTLFTDPNGDGNPADGVVYDSPFVTLTGGAYIFTNLPPGAYVVVETQPSGYLTVTDGDTTNGSDDAVNLSATDDRIPVAVAANETDTGNDFVEEQPGTISGTVWADTNNDNTGDVGIAGVVLTLKDSSGNDIDSDPNTGGVQPTTVTTGVGGIYSFTNLPPGSYRVVETQPSGYLSVSDTDGSNNNVIGDQNPIVVVAGQTNAGNDFVEEQPGAIRGSVLADTDGDGDGDAPLANILIHLLDASGNPVDSDPNTSGIQAVTTLTLADGSYSFGGLAPGNYRVREDQPAGYNSVSDTDGANNNIIGDETPINVTAGGTSNGHDFIEIEPASIAGHVYADTDNNGSGDTPLAGVTLALLDGSGNPIDGSPAPGVQLLTAVTLADGSYLFANLPPGGYRVSQMQPGGYASVSDVDGANNNLIGDETPIVLLPGDDATGKDFVEVQYGSIAGSVFDDTDDNGSGDAPIAGITLALLDGAGQPVLNGFGQPITTATLADGSYFFANVLPGNYQVAETQPAGYGSVSDVDGGNLDLIGNVTPIAVAPGQHVTGRDFVEIRLGAISGFVFAGTDPLSGVTLALLDENGDPVLDGNGDPITTITGPDGSYRFDGVFPGTYKVGQIQPHGYDSFGDADGGDINIVGDVTPIVVLPGQTNEDNNFIEIVDTCANDWLEWLEMHPGENASGNPDGDVLDNLAEFAFSRPYDNGSGSAFCINPSTFAPGTIEGTFVRPKQATNHVTYVLEYASVLGNPTAWQSIALEPGDLIVTDNGDCTESVVIFDLENLTGLSTGEGFIRIRAELDENEDETIDHVSHTPVKGWTRTPVGISCRTYNNPYLHCAAFTGTIDSANGSTMTLTTSAGTVDLATLLQSGVSYYAEITSGENEGHRFDVISATGDTLTVANDSDLSSGLAPFNTLTGTLPASLAGDGIAIRAHWTLNELFPPEQYGATDSQSTADQVQVNSAGTWTIYWLYDDNGEPRWVKDASLADEGVAVLPPGQGVFFNSRQTTGSILAWGEVRANDFIRPLAKGSSLVGGGYPLDQKATGLRGREMTLAQGFFGSRDFKKADRFYVWKGDAVMSATGYDGYFLLNGAPVQPSLVQWTRTGDTTLQSYSAATLFLGDRAVFMDLANPIFTYEMPTPWIP